jgi:tetratricopeptide (TPR) repeat protein
MAANKENLVRVILERFIEKNRLEDKLRVRYAKCAIAVLDALSTAIDVGFDSITEESAQVWLVDPVVDRCERLPYALFIHKMFLYSDCYGMVHEDPINSIVLLNGALSIVKSYATTEEHLVPVSLDLLLQQAIAYQAARSNRLAKKAARMIIEVASEVESARKQVGKKDREIADNLMADIQMRAAPSAWILYHLLKGENEGSSHDALKLSSELYESLFTSKLIPKVGLEWIGVLIGYAEALIVQESIDKSMRLLKRATKLAESELQDSFSIAYAFVAAAAYHKQAEIYAMSANWGKVQDCFEHALHWCSRAIEEVPCNTHLEDRYTEYLNELAIMYGISGNLPKAQDLFITTIGRRRKLASMSEQYKTGLASTLNNMSILMRTFGNDIVAKEYIRESIEILSNLESEYELDGMEEMRSALTDGLNSIERSIKNRKLSSWRPLWNPPPPTNSAPN